MGLAEVNAGSIFNISFKLKQCNFLVELRPLFGLRKYKEKTHYMLVPAFKPEIWGLSLPPIVSILGEEGRGKPEHNIQ